MPFEINEKITIAVIDTSEETEFCNSIEEIRRCPNQDTINTSWDRSFALHESKVRDINKTPPFESIMVTDDPSPEKGNTSTSSTQTEPYLSLPVNCSFVDVSLSFSKDFNIQDSTSNENSEQCLGSKRYRRDSSDADHKELRPWKKKCTDSCSSSTSDLSEPKLTLGPSGSSCLSSNSEASFKSINSNHSYKIRKRRLKSESNLIRDALQRARKSTNFNKHNYSETSTAGELT